MNQERVPIEGLLNRWSAYSDATAQSEGTYYVGGSTQIADWLVQKDSHPQLAKWLPQYILTQGSVTLPQ